MIPVLFEIGPVTVYSYGAMLAIGFLLGAWFLRVELRRWGYNEDISDHVVIGAMVGGVAGAKLYFVFIEAPGRMVQDPWGTLFSGAGLTYYGGLIGAVAVVLLIARWHKVPMLKLLDMTGPLAVLGYGWGRVGCFLSGDGDYGPPSNLGHDGIYNPPMAWIGPHQVAVPNDIPWSVAFPDGTVPTTLPVHPTPVYEFLTIWAAFLVLWFFVRKLQTGRGFMIGISFVVMGVERFITEFWRLESSVLVSYGYNVALGTTQRELDAFSAAVQAHYSGWLGLSTAQWISVWTLLAGIALILWSRRMPPEIPPAADSQQSANKAKA